METIPQILERAWAGALPGREVAERNSVWRQLWALQRARALQEPCPRGAAIASPASAIEASSAVAATKLGGSK